MDISGNVYIGDRNNNKLRMVTSSGIITTFAGTGAQGSNGDGGAATSAQLCYPIGVSVGISGNVYIADACNNKIRKVTSAGLIATIAGTGTAGSSGDGGAATSAQLNFPAGVSLDIYGSVYIADLRNHKIRKVTSAGIITTIAGTGDSGSSGDGGAATSAQLNCPTGVSVDISGNVYIADTNNHMIRMVTSTGIITTIAGTGTAGSSGDGGAATSAQLYNPTEVSVDISGNVYIAVVDNNKIRIVSSSGIITAIAGTGSKGSSGDGGAATSAQLNGVFGVSVGISGNVYIADTSNNKIRMVVPPLFPTSQPTMQPTLQPTHQPTVQPSRRPSKQPTNQPSRHPSSQPSRTPSSQPSKQPSKQPTRSFLFSPSTTLTLLYFTSYSRFASMLMSYSFLTHFDYCDSFFITLFSQPTVQPSRQPTRRPSREPTQQPTRQPSQQPTQQPSQQPTRQPSSRPTSRPTAQPLQISQSFLGITTTAEITAFTTYIAAALTASLPANCALGTITILCLYDDGTTDVCPSSSRLLRSADINLQARKVTGVSVKYTVIAPPSVSGATIASSLSTPATTNAIASSLTTSTGLTGITVQAPIVQNPTNAPTPAPTYNPTYGPTTYAPTVVITTTASPIATPATAPVALPSPSAEAPSGSSSAPSNASATSGGPPVAIIAGVAGGGGLLLLLVLGYLFYRQHAARKVKKSQIIAAASPDTAGSGGGVNYEINDPLANLQNNP